MTIGEVGQKIREDMNRRFDQSEQFCYLKSLTKPFEASTPIEGNIWSHSSIGPITFKRPIVDAWINTSGLNGGSGNLCLLTYSICSPEKRRCDVVLNMQYDENIWNAKEVERMNEYIKYVMTRVPLDLKISEVYSSMEKEFPKL